MRSRSSISAAWSRIGSPWPGSTSRAGSSRVARIESMYWISARGRGLRRRRRPTAAGTRAGSRRCARAGGRRRSASARRSSNRIVSDGLCPGRWWTRSVRSRKRRARRRRAAAGSPRRSTRTPGTRRRPRRARRQVLGHPVAAHHRLRELVVGGRAGARSPPGTARAGATRRPRRPSGGRGSPAGRGDPCAGG